MDAGGRGEPGEIQRLVELIGEHPGAIRYDWRTRFGLPVESIFDGRMSWDEAWDLVTELVRDPTSHLFAAINEWKHPFSSEARVLADLFDLQVAMNTKKGKKPKPYPRPWSKKTQGVRSQKPTVDQATIRAALAQRGH